MTTTIMARARRRSRPGWRSRSVKRGSTPSRSGVVVSLTEFRTREASRSMAPVEFPRARCKHCFKQSIFRRAGVCGPWAHSPTFLLLQDGKDSRDKELRRNSKEQHDGCGEHNRQSGKSARPQNREGTRFRALALENHL